LLLVIKISRGHDMASDIRKLWADVRKKWMLNPDKPGSPKYWSPELETCPRDKIKEIQSEKLEVAFRYLYECSPFYREKYKRAKLSPSDIKSVDDLHKIPITSKKEWREDLEKNPPWGTFSCIDEDIWKERGWIVWLTSGTTGKPTPIRYTQEDRKMQQWFIARQYWMSGVRPGDFLMFCVPFTTHVFAWDHYVPLQTMGIPMIAAGPPIPTEARIDMIKRLNPTVMLGTPSYMLYLGEIMKNMGLDPRDTSVRAIFVAGEPGGSILSTKRRIMDLWGAKVGDLFGCTEVGGAGIATICEEELEDLGRPSNLHFNEDGGIPEVVDPETLEPLPEGKEGQLVWTDFSSESMPIPRFNLGDFTVISSEFCACGRTSRLSVGGLRGRTEDMINIRGVTVFPSAIEQSLREIPELGDEYQIVLTEKMGLTEMTIEVEPKPEIPEEDYPSLEKKIVEKLKVDCQIRTSISFLPYGSIPKAEFKAKRIKDLRG